MQSYSFKCFVLFLINLQVHAKTFCHPLPNFWQKQFIIGYGSLLSEKSKKTTVEKISHNTPIFLKDYQRAWNVRQNQKTYLGVKPKRNGKISAVFFPVSIHHIFRFDYREKGYCRFALTKKNIIAIPNSNQIPPGQYWLYVPQKYDKRQGIIPHYYIKIFKNACKKIALDNKSPEYYQSCLKILSKQSLN